VTGNTLADNGGYGVTAPSGPSVTLGENTFRGNKSGDTKIEPPAKK